MINGLMMQIHVLYNIFTRSICGLFLAVVLTACGSTPMSTPDRAVTKPTFNQSVYEAALEMMKQKKYAEAITSLESVIRESGNRVGPFINLGISYKEMGKYDDSKKALLTATQMEKGSAIAFNELGLVYRRLGEFDRARKAYMKSISNKSRYRFPYRNLGILCDIYLQDLPCAIRNYKKYQNLTGNKNKEVRLWIVDLKNRMNKQSRGK